MKTIHIAIVLATSAALFAACSDSKKSKIDPEADPDLLSQALGKVQLAGQDAERKEGDLPVASTNAAAPIFVLGDKIIPAAKGERVSFPFSVSSESALSQLFAKVVGAPDFFEVSLSDNTKLQSDYTFGFNLPNNVLDGTACFDLGVRDANGLVGRSSEVICVVIASQAATPTPTTEPTGSTTPTPTAAPAPTGSVTPTPTSAPTSEPTVAPTPVTGGDATAASCFNPGLLVPGTQIVQKFRSSTDQGSAEFTDERTVVGNTTYDGRDALQTMGTTNTTLSTGESYTSDTTTYSQVNSQVPSINTIGVETSSNETGTTVQSTTTINPGNLQRFDLNPGQSFTQTFSRTTTTTIAGITSTDGGDVSVEKIFEGREMVTVDAGTFDTCVFLTNEDNGYYTGGTKSSTSSRVYIDVQSGLVVKSVADGTFSELLEATINGNSIR